MSCFVGGQLFQLVYLFYIKTYLDYFILFRISKIKTTRSYLSVCVSSLQLCVPVITQARGLRKRPMPDAACSCCLELVGRPYPSRMRRLQLNGVRVFYRPFVWQGRGRSRRWRRREISAMWEDVAVMGHDRNHKPRHRLIF